MEYPTWNEWKAYCESKGQAPNYSFDNWLKMTQTLGDDVTSFVGQAREKDAELDDKIKDKKKEPPKDEDDDDPEEKSKDRQTAWKKLKDIAKERQEQAKKDLAKDAKKQPSKSSTK